MARADRAIGLGKSRVAMVCFTRGFEDNATWSVALQEVRGDLTWCQIARDHEV